LISIGYNLSMPSLIGAASLAGIVANNAMLEDLGWGRAPNPDKP